VTFAEDKAPLVVPVDGEPFPARLVAIDQHWQLTFQGEGGRRTLPGASLVRWGQCADIPPGPAVVLTDGGLLVGEVTAADREFVSVESSLFGTLRLPRPMVAGVLFHPPADRVNRDLLVDRILATASDSDVAILRNGDELTGTVQRIAEGKVHLESLVGAVTLDNKGVGAIRYRPTVAPSPDGPRASQGLSACAGFADGSRLMASALSLAEDVLQISVQGAKRWGAAPKEMVFLQPRGGQAVYLSDLKLEGYRHVSYLAMRWPFRSDRSVCGAMLRVDGRTYLKGLGMHSASRITFALSEPYRRFQSALAVDDLAEGGGSVAFRVFVDGQVRYSSPVIRGGQDPLPISVDLAGATRLDLVVDFAERADELDRADWLDARLIR